ncbi:MAG: transcription antitermination protein NusB, partial [Clostridia bacterium]|nr:transcription antitermination protein NusB [Clostridia bacterium]
YIEKYAKGWNVGRISRISKAILRLSMYEILYMDIPVGASVNEALELAKKYDGEETVGFINGILSSFSKNEIIK